MGRGRGIPHGQGQVSSIPVVGIDHFFITRRGVERRPRGIDLDPKGPDTDLNDDEVIDGFPEGGIEGAYVEPARPTGAVAKCIIVMYLELKFMSPCGAVRGHR